jgi:hypothetical protein
LVYKSVLKSLKKLAIPFTVVSTSSLFFTIHQAKAQTISGWLHERGNIKNNPFSKENLQNEGTLQKIQESLEQWETIWQQINKGIEWLNHLPEHVPQMSVNLLSWIYELLSKFILITPVWLFKNTWFSNTTLVFSILSVAVVIILTIIESIKKMYNHKSIHYTKFSTILKRFPIAVAGAGFAPILYEKAFELLNKLSQSISSIGKSYIAKEQAITFNWSTLDLIAVIGFDLVLISLLFPIFLKNGRRYFDILALGTLTPLALTTWIFDDYRHLFHKWWKHMKQLSLMQITYSIFICLLGVLIFGTRNFTPEGAFVFIVKLMIIAGGLWRLANPPTFVLAAGDTGRDSWSIGKELINTFTLKKFVPIEFFNKEIKPHIDKYKQKKQEEKEYIEELIKKNLERLKNKQ